jgi:protocatechuate 3,4-dioxygenase alpha subunit
MSTDAITPGQTVGPFFGFALPYPEGNLLVPPHHPDAVRLHGFVRDGDGQPVPDALLEIWQADRDGRPGHRPGSLHRDGNTFTGWGRSATDATGHYSFSTVEPSRAEGGPAFIGLTVFARGLLHRLFTRIYLPAQPDLTSDPFLLSLPDERRATLIADRDAADSLRFVVHFQGARETVFLSFTPAVVDLP